MASRPLVVGSWPGPGFAWNDFIGVFCGSVAAAGGRVVAVDDPRRVTEALDVLHIHWPEQVFWGGGSPARLAWRTLATLRGLGRLQRSGTRLVWMVHNLRPHDRSAARNLLWRALSGRLARQVDGWMTLSPATVPAITAAYPALTAKPVAAPWHPAYPAGPAGERAAQGTQVAFLGLIRPYKGIETLIEAFRGAPPNHRLLIAGKPDPDGYGGELTQLAAADPRIEVRLGRLDDDAMAGLAAAASVIALPFRDYLHSGSMIYALSQGRPVVTPSTPFADALAAAVGRDWVRTYRGRLTAADLDVSLPPGRPDLSALEPALIGQAAMSLYRRLVEAGEKRAGMA